MTMFTRGVVLRVAQKQLRCCSKNAGEMSPQSLDLQIKLKKSSTMVLMNEIEELVRSDPHSERVLQMYKKEEADLASLLAEKESISAPFYEDMNDKIRTVKGEVTALASSVTKLKKKEAFLSKRLFIVKLLDHKAGVPYGWREATYEEAESYLQHLSDDLRLHKFTLLADVCVNSDGLVVEELPSVYFPTAHIITPDTP